MSSLTFWILILTLTAIAWVNILQGNELNEIQNHLKCLDKRGYSYVAPNDCEKI